MCLQPVWFHRLTKRELSTKDRREHQSASKWLPSQRRYKCDHRSWLPKGRSPPACSHRLKKRAKPTLPRALRPVVSTFRPSLWRHKRDGGSPMLTPQPALFHPLKRRHNTRPAMAHCLKPTSSPNWSRCKSDRRSPRPVYCHPPKKRRHSSYCL